MIRNGRSGCFIIHTIVIWQSVRVHGRELLQFFAYFLAGLMKNDVDKFQTG